MTYPDYRARFNNVRNQYNIMALVGNGFDIQVLTELGSHTDTRYQCFYHFLKYRSFDPENLILSRMEHLRTNGAKNWADVESAIDALRASVAQSDIVADLKKIQREFAVFLNQVVTPSILSELGTGAAENGLSTLSYTEFLGDVDDPDEYKKMSLPRRLDIGDLLNFRFVNFNYTPLLDDFVYLDQDQFDPHPYRTSDRNLNFRPNPRGYKGDSDGKSLERQDFHMASYLVSEVVHPHGTQSIPRSLLFGVDETISNYQQLSKPYWAQNDVKYAELFPQTDLFIIFGCSLGETDRWWWRAVVEGLRSNENADLMLYWRRGNDELALVAEDVRKKLAVAGGYENDDDVLSLLESKARVVLYNHPSDRVWLNTNAATLPTWVGA